MSTKKCSRCKIEKETTYFGRRPKNTDGFKGVCKKCETEKMTSWYRKDRVKYNTRNRELGARPVSRFSRFKKRCVFTGKHFDLTFEQWSYLVLDKNCHYCSGPLESKGCALDRMDNSIGYTVANVVPCCKECNRLKGPSLTHQEMVQVSKLLKEMRAV